MKIIATRHGRIDPKTDEKTLHCGDPHLDPEWLKKELLKTAATIHDDIMNGQPCDGIFTGSRACMLETATSLQRILQIPEGNVTRAQLLDDRIVDHEGKYYPHGSQIEYILEQYYYQSPELLGSMFNNYSDKATLVIVSSQLRIGALAAFGHFKGTIPAPNDLLAWILWNVKIARGGVTCFNVTRRAVPPHYHFDQQPS